MYNDNFDKELIDYLVEFFKSQKITQLDVKSNKDSDNRYNIHFENKEQEIILKLLYEKKDEKCEAQIRITNILIKGKLKGKGLSKKLINNLLDYCHKHEDMSLWILQLINKNWKEYLIQKGAIIAKEETSLEGAILSIQNKIN